MKVSFTQILPKEDPIHGTPCSRSSHGVSIVTDGTRLVLYGGEHTARMPLETEQTLWIACQNGGEWEWKCVLSDLEQQPPARIGHAQAAVGNDVFIFGGRAGITMKEMAMNDLWKFDTNTFKWAEVKTNGSPPAPRSFHRMIYVNDRFLYVFGGCGEDGRLADLYKFDLETSTWHTLEPSPLRGRGGANILQLKHNKLAIVAGYAGEETNDGHTFLLDTEQWEEDSLEHKLKGLRPRSVCVAASSSMACLIFGGEVNPSERGHEGAGGFTNDIVLMDPETCEYLSSIPIVNPLDKNWPQPRGWSDGSIIENTDAKGRKEAQLYIFGGLSGDDSNPIRLNDLWRMNITT